jgi:uncharacterized protein YcbK (DUF882 family)
MSIKLTDAAKFFKGEPQQIDALEWLQAQLTADVLELFAEKYRNKPKPTPTVDNTWDAVFAAAETAGSKWPECVAAQWALESGWGKHFSGTWNAFGLKGSGSTVNTQEFINGQWVTIKAGFIDFPDLQTCVHYLVDRWYKDYGRFKGVNRASSRNECARLLVKEGYATDPEYATKLIQIMDRQLQTIGEKEDPDPHNNNFNPWSPYTYKVTPNITYGELTLNQEARRFTRQHQCDTAKELCLFLEKVRKQFGNKPLVITSASRPEPINSRVGGSKNSEHTYNAPSKGAIDFYIQGVNTYTVQDWCDKNWPYSLGYGAPKGFVHVGIREGKPRVRWNY